jgi:UDP-glucose 4-epimerase
LEGCRLNKVKKFIYASSVYVYSKEGGFYRCSKQAAESYVEEYNSRFGIETTILRFGSLYGPRSGIENGLYKIVETALKLNKIIYHGNKDSLREYIHVSDAAKASVLAIKPEYSNQSIVLTGQEPMRVLDMLEILSEILGYKGKVEFIESNHVGHYVRTPYSYQSSLSRKYIPDMHIDLGQGLIELIDLVKNNGHKL